MKSPNIHLLVDVVDMAGSTTSKIDDVWVPARPLGYQSLRHRLKATWLVFTGRADALIWPMGQ